METTHYLAKSSGRTMEFSIPLDTRTSSIPQSPLHIGPSSPFWGMEQFGSGVMMRNIIECSAICKNIQYIRTELRRIKKHHVTEIVKGWLVAKLKVGGANTDICICLRHFYKVDVIIQLSLFTPPIRNLLQKAWKVVCALTHISLVISTLGQSVMYQA